MFDYFFQLFDNFSVVILFLLVMTIEAGVPVPIPYDIVIILAGYRQIDLAQVTAAVVLGNVAGSSLLYYVSYRFGHRLFVTHLRWFGITQHRLKIVEQWFNHWGAPAIVLARLIPGFRFAATFVSGILCVPYITIFLPSLTIGSLLWAVSYWLIGLMLGAHIPVVLRVFNVWSTVIAIGFSCIIVAVSYKIIKGMYGKRNTKR